MTTKRIGVHALGEDSNAVVARIQELERLGIHAAWLPTGSGPQDSLTLFAAAAALTKTIVLGSSIVPTYPRHPIIVAQQTFVLNQIAPQRFVLGIGSSHRPRIEEMYGMAFRTPLAHTREYLHIVRTLLHEGAIDFDGRHFKAHTKFNMSAPEVPVMISALRQASFELAGAESDGAISWICPMVYLRDVALSAMKSGAQRADRQVPPLIVHAPVCVHDNRDEVREAVNEQLIYYLHLQFYLQMLIEAGYPEAAEGIWSDAMMDAVVLYGDEKRVKERIHWLFELGASEVILTPITAGPDRGASMNRTINLVAQVAKTI